MRQSGLCLRALLRYQPCKDKTRQYSDTLGLETEQTLTINITVKSNTLSREALKEAFKAISNPLTGNIFAYILTNFPLYSGGEPGKDFTVEFIRSISD